LYNLCSEGELIQNIAEGSIGFVTVCN
jgi:hypothetical protein